MEMGFYGFTIFKIKKLFVQRFILTLFLSSGCKLGIPPFSIYLRLGSRSQSKDVERNKVKSTFGAKTDQIKVL